jgi:hypothetical protein
VIESIEQGRFNETTNGEYSDDHMDVTSSAYPFALFPLYWGAEALSHDFITMIKEADWNKIKVIQSRFYPQYDPVSGRTYAPEYWYLSPSQKSQAWVYIKERKKQLQDINEDDLSQPAKQCLYWIRQYKKSKYSTALIYAFAEGRDFDSFGITVQFDSPGSGQEVNYLWTQYRKLTR